MNDHSLTFYMHAPAYAQSTTTVGINYAKLSSILTMNYSKCIYSSLTHTHHNTLFLVVGTRFTPAPQIPEKHAHTE